VTNDEKYRCDNCGDVIPISPICVDLGTYCSPECRDNRRTDFTEESD